jgi:putative transposase
LVASFILILWRRLRQWLAGFSASSRRYGRRTAGTPAPARSVRKPEWVVDRVIHLKALIPDAGCRLIATTFNRLHGARTGITVGKSFVAETIRRHRYAIEDERRRVRRRRAKRGPRNRIWAIDLTGKQDTTGTCHDILGLIDHGTRRLLALKPIPTLSSWTLLGHLCLAIGEFGKPAALRTDNGSVFTSRCFRAGLTLIGIRHQLSEVGCPWQNGRIERLFGTLKAKLDRWRVTDFGELARALSLFRFWYNAVRPHQNLGGATPLEAWHDIDPFARPPRRAIRFSAWDGLLTGYFMRR